MHFLYGAGHWAYAHPHTRDTHFPYGAVIGHMRIRMRADMHSFMSRSLATCVPICARYAFPYGAVIGHMRIRMRADMHSFMSRSVATCVPICARYAFPYGAVIGHMRIPYSARRYDQADLDAVCAVCFSGEDEATLLLCDAQCGRACHAACDGLDAVPEGDWYCRRCREGTDAAAAAAVAAGGAASHSSMARGAALQRHANALLTLAGAGPAVGRGTSPLAAAAAAGMGACISRVVAGARGGAVGGTRGGGGAGLGGSLTRIRAPAAGVPRAATRAEAPGSPGAAPYGVAQ